MPTAGPMACRSFHRRRTPWRPAWNGRCCRLTSCSASSRCGASQSPRRSSPSTPLWRAACRCIFLPSSPRSPRCSNRSFCCTARLPRPVDVPGYSAGRGCTSPGSSACRRPARRSSSPTTTATGTRSRSRSPPATGAPDPGTGEVDDLEEQDRRRVHGRMGHIPVERGASATTQAMHGRDRRAARPVRASASSPRAPARSAASCGPAAGSGGWPRPCPRRRSSAPG